MNWEDVTDAEIPEWHKVILEERLKELESDDTEMLDWDIVKNEL